MRDPTLNPALFLRSPEKDHELVYDAGGKTEEVRGRIIDLDNSGYVEIELRGGRRHYVPKDKVIVIREPDEG